MEKEKLKVEMEVTITQEDVDDIMATALEGGITYWCCEAEVVGEYLGKYASDQISRGGILKLYDNEEDEVYELTLEKFKKGVMMYLSDPQAPYNIIDIDKGDYTLDCGMVDGDVADMIVQYALFGEVMFG